MRRPALRAVRIGLAAGMLLSVSVACGSDDERPSTDAGEDTGDAGDAGEAEAGDDVREPELRAELLEMMEADQAERTGAVGGEWNDEERTARLVEIMDEHGWPGIDLVGEDGATAAWLIAQHSDLDVDVQARALELMREAVDAGQANPTDLAYLEDRVALNTGKPQIYGTQVGCVDGRAEPADMIEPDTVDDRRADVGLQPLADYLADFQPDCEAEAEAQASG
jgi:hypothetical protein